jgi:hypothetical protein
MIAARKRTVVAGLARRGPATAASLQLIDLKTGNGGFTMSNPVSTNSWTWTWTWTWTVGQGGT